MKLCFQFDLWRPSPCHLEPAGTRERQAPVSSRHAGKIAQTWPTRRVQKSLVYSVNICRKKKHCRKKNCRKKNWQNKKTTTTTTTTKKGHKMVPQSLGWWWLMIVSAHAHKPDFEPLLKIYFELYFLLFFFPLPFVLVLLSTLYGDRKALAVFFNRKKRLFLTWPNFH